jgi:lipopolysaccharide/colanic/teichoic acid biosynthesis glycosyltransferase
LYKRVLDLAGAGFGLVLLSPLFAAIALCIKLTSPGPVFFRQERMGLNGETFRIFKFRTMTDGAHKKGSHVTSRNDSRITTVGRFLRRYKLDEYPQLINVLLGQMSLVGPRPEVPRYVKAYPSEFARLCTRKPGMTHKVSLMLRHEEEILAGSADPESMYVNSVLPWKLGLYLDERSPESIADDILTICRTVFSRDRELQDQVPRFPAARVDSAMLDAPEVANVPAHPVSRPAATLLTREDARQLSDEEVIRTGTGHN